MDSEFPPFQQTGFYKSWLRCVAMFPTITKAQEEDTLRMALSLYCRVKERWEVERRGKSGDGSDLW